MINIADNKCINAEIYKDFSLPNFAGIENNLFSLSNSSSWSEYKISNPAVHNNTADESNKICPERYELTAINAPAGAIDRPSPKIKCEKNVNLLVKL